SVPDVRPYYRRAWLQIVPLRIGGGTRLKIVESMAMKTAVVSTSIGAQGLGLRHEHNILLADTAADFVRETARALKDAALRERLEGAGLHTVRERLSWPILGQRFCDIIERALENNGGEAISHISIAHGREGTKDEIGPQRKLPTGTSGGFVSKQKGGRPQTTSGSRRVTEPGAESV